MSLISESHFDDTRVKLRGLFLLVVLLACAVGVRAQQPPAGRMRLTRIEWVGLQRVKEEEVATASGLRVGQEVDVAALDAAAERVLASGLVTRLGYKLREAAGQATVTFEVVEAKREGNVPVVFDNFVWFTREELVEAVRRELPEFDGRMAESNSAVAGATRALEKLLRERKIEGEVDYMPQASITGGDAKHVFTVKGVSLPVCSVSFTGAAVMPERELLTTAQQVLGTDYSQEMVAGFADSAVKSLYHQRGHLKVRFGEPRAALDASASCKGGVSVAVPVEEGPAYAWDRAIWVGNTALAPAELDAALAMRAGEVANTVKIERQLREVRKLYGRKGYLMIVVRPAQEFADEARRVAYRFNVHEGPQFRMGTLTITGLGAAETERLRAQWKLRPGEIFDASYLDGYLKSALTGLFRPGTKLPKVETQTRPDRQRLTADVFINFKFE